MPDMIMTLVSLFVAAALYAWVGVTLGAVFRALGGAPWKAWFPLVSQVEMLRLARRPGWHIVLLVVPIYGLVVYYQVLRELTRLFGRPAGLALIGVVVLPIWAGAVTGGTAKRATRDETSVGSLGVDSLFGRAPAGPGATSPAATVYPSPAVPQSPAPVGAVPGGGTPVPQVALYHSATVYPEPVMSLAPVAPDQLVPPVLPAQPAPAVVPAQPSSCAQPVVAELVAPAEVPVAASPPVVAQHPVPAQPQMVHGSSGPAPSVVADTPVPGAVVAQAEAAVAAVPDPLSAVPPVEAGRSMLRPVPSGLEVSDHTVVIDRASSRLWSLVLEDGRSFDLWASSVVVGREPTPTDDGVQMLVIPDETRTLSKRHARFDLVDGAWQVTDLDSTNGIVVASSDGRASAVRSGRTSVVDSQLVLGSVAMRLVTRASLARSA